MLVAALALWVAGCGPTLSPEERKQALKVIDRVKTQVARRNYNGALRLFDETAQKNIRNVGGKGTPIEGFFRALRPMLERRDRVEISRGVVWVTYLHGKEDEKLLVAVTKTAEKGWLITRMRGNDWSI
ncbi:MAG: hypothetical protein CMJ18_25060 [Phycisphaeraceae bacterium]|nr:hypothetical protein [Phycisphaeraceae bacterium]